MNSGSMDESAPRRCLIQDKRRLADVEQKQDRVRQFLNSCGADALLLQDPANLAWFTAGADLTRNSPDSCQTSLFITEEARLFATNAVDSSQLFEREAFGLGFQLKQREWYQPHSSLIEDLCRGRRVVSDSGFEGTKNVAKRLQKLRLPLTELEVERYRKLAQVLVHSVEVTCSHVRKGLTEAAIAGELSHRLTRRTITPVRIQVCADGRNQRYRHWSFGEDPIENYVTVSCVARRWGLHCAVSRTVCLNEVPQDLWAAHQKALLMHATGIFFSRSGQQLKDVWPKVQRIYEKFGLPSEWQLSDQADVMGYRLPEHQLTPGSEFELQAPTPLFWHPGVAAAMPGDTVLVQNGGCEILTGSTAWPDLRVQVKGHDVTCPGLLLIHDAKVAAKTSQDQPVHSLFQGFEFHDEPDDTRVDSIWELDMTSNRSVFDESDSSYSEESVLD
ncbi:MAG: M24 family metallopeptidase [Planctomycetaceae bacterium]|nr:M24 family metallopeptidase [Planctomycetaceae bacterium]